MQVYRNNSQYIADSILSDGNRSSNLCFLLLIGFCTPSDLLLSNGTKEVRTKTLKSCLMIQTLLGSYHFQQPEL